MEIHTLFMNRKIQYNTNISSLKTTDLWIKSKGILLPDSN